jgi:hypothetical protein
MAKYLRRHLLFHLKHFFMARYGKKAQDKVEKAMHEMKRGELKSGRSGKKVTNPKQAVAIGLSEAREEGGKVPSPESRSTRGGQKSKGGRKSSSRRRS